MNPRPRLWGAPLLTLIAVAASIIGAFIGSGALWGTPISEAAGGWLSPDATPLAPGSGAFRIWSVIYVGLAGYAVWQLLPTVLSSSRQQPLRLWAILSAALNAAWVWMVQLGWLLASVVVIIALLVVLIRMLILLSGTRPKSWPELILADGTFGLYLGWTCVATVANVAAWLGSLGAATFPGWLAAAYGVLLLTTVVGVGVAMFTRGKLAPALAISWGVGWIAVGRLDSQFISEELAWGAGIASAAVLVATVLVRVRAALPLVPQR